MQAPDFHHIAAFVTSFDVTGEDIADCKDSDEFASYIADARPQYAKRCYRFLLKFLQENAGWLCTVRSRFVAHDSQPACTRQTRLPGSYALLLYEAGLCLLCSRVHVSFILRIFCSSRGSATQRDSEQRIK